MATDGMNNVVVAHLGVLVAEFLFAFVLLATQVILNQGVNKLVLACYSLGFSSLLLWIPASLTARDSNMKVSLKLLSWTLLLGLLVFLIQVFGLIGQDLTSPSFGIGMQPLSSIFTAVFSVLFGVEKLVLKRYDGKVKASGILICVAGAMLMAIYRGPCIIDCTGEQPIHATTSSKSFLQFQLGALCVIISNIVSGFLGAISTKLLYKGTLSPAPLLATMFTMGTLIGGSVAFVQADRSDWVLHGWLTFVLIILNVLAVSTFPMLLIKSVFVLGPTIVSCYQPVCTIVTIFASVVLFGSPIYIGSVIGAGILVLGLLCVSWAQEQFTKLSTSEALLPSCN